ncbi:hypothetical protein M426DRAFT_324931 [Hypoxylon sp. CI-4A]|nr:hypothetical protein M426DRAFT_324931 [Hypoxylon sp. CI-4A]
MAHTGQKDWNKAGKSFDTGSTNALSTVDQSSGIFEAPSVIQPEAQVTKPVSTSRGHLDKQASALLCDSRIYQLILARLTLLVLIYILTTI